MEVLGNNYDSVFKKCSWIVTRQCPTCDQSFVFVNSNIILKRYDTYMDMTRPVLDFYSKNSNFYEIDGALKIEQISSKIDAFLNV